MTDIGSPIEIATFATQIMLAATGGYLLGSIPFGLVITRAAGLGDIREIGSGNIGATNVLRTGRKDLAAATLILDSGKGAAAVLLGSLIDPAFGVAAGAAAVIGHLFPVWLKFRGGKGVATFLGTLLAMDFRVGLMACAVWVAMALIFRYSSLSALVAASLAPAFFLVFEREAAAGATLVLALLIFWRHRGNIERLVRGEEPRIGRKSEKPDDQAAAK